MHRKTNGICSMTDGMDSGKATLQDARIVQANVMDETCILLNFSNGSSALVSSEAVKELVMSAVAKVAHHDEVSD